MLGLGDWDSIEKIKIEWPDGKIEELNNVQANQVLNLDYKNAAAKPKTVNASKPLLKKSSTQIPYQHIENNYTDFDFDALVLHMNSNQGPALAVADLNGDGLDDTYLGAALGQVGQIYLQKPAGDFVSTKLTAFERDRIYEDVAACFIDFDADGDQDLYVVSGGSERVRGISYQDRLYINETKGGNIKFVLSKESLPAAEISGACVKPFDFDGDGDIDLFVGARINPVKYGIPVTSQLLENRDGKFIDITKEKAPQLEALGMVTDAAWTDIDDDGKTDLILVGEWMPITVFKNRGAGFQKIDYPGFEQTHGLWNTIQHRDLNGDGLEELIVGNLGLNTRFKASPAQPLHLFINDFDKNQNLDLIYAHYDESGNLVPFSTKHQVTAQLPYLKKRFLKFKDYAGKTMEEVFGGQLNEALALKVEMLSSMLFENKGDRFDAIPLPEIVQYSTTNAMEFMDLDGDAIDELIVGGNSFGIQPQLGQYDANFGVVLKWEDQSWNPIPYKQSGLNVKGEVKHIKNFESGETSKVLFVRNNEAAIIYELNTENLEAYEF